MTISTTISRVTYLGDGITTDFAVPFVFFGANEVAVIERDLATGTEAAKILVSDYTVTGGAGGGGAVLANLPPPVGRSWTVFRRTHRTQLVDYTPNDPFPAETHERALDRLTALVQELDDRLDRTAVLSPASALGSLTLPSPSADRVIGWRHDLTGLENKTLAVGSAVYASIAATAGGTAETEAVTPRGLAALWRRGANIVSAATLAAPADTDRGGYHLVTGNVAIAALWPAPVGETLELRFAANLTLLHDPVTLILPSGGNVAARAGDVARFRSEGAGNWRCVSGPPHWHGIGDTAISLPVVAASGAHIMAASDLGREICFSAAGVTLAMLPVANAGNGGLIAVRNMAASGDVTLDPDGSETLDGFATRKLRPGDCVLLRCDGGAWHTLAGDYTYDSGELTITSGGLLTLAHGLNRRPWQMRTYLRCKTTDSGWAVGDEVEVTVASTGTGFGTHRAMGLRSDDTNIAIRYGGGASAFGYAFASTGVEASLVNTSWRLIVKARAK